MFLRKNSLTRTPISFQPLPMTVVSVFVFLGVCVVLACVGMLLWRATRPAPLPQTHRIRPVVDDRSSDDSSSGEDEEFVEEHHILGGSLDD